MRIDWFKLMAWIGIIAVTIIFWYWFIHFLLWIGG